MPHLVSGFRAHGYTNEELFLMIPLFVGLLSDADCDIRRNAMMTLFKLSDSDRNSPIIQAAIMEAGAVASIVGILSNESDNDEDALCSALHALNCLTCESTNNNVQNKSEVVQAGAIVPLVKLLSYKGDWSVRCAACYVLADLATNDEYKVLMASHGAVVSLVNLLSDNDGYVRKSAALALQTLIKDYPRDTEQPIIISQEDMATLQRMHTAAVTDKNNNDEEVKHVLSSILALCPPPSSDRLPPHVVVTTSTIGSIAEVVQQEDMLSSTSNHVENDEKDTPSSQLFSEVDSRQQQQQQQPWFPTTTKVCTTNNNN